VNSAIPKKKHRQAVEIWKRFKKNPIAMAGLFIIILMFLLAIFADVLAPGTDIDPGYDIQRLQAHYRRQFPGRNEVTGEMHFMGTDHLGRDLFARVAHGSRITLLVGFVVVSIAMVSGIILGSIAGFYGGVADNVIMRAVDIILAMPTILLAIAISAAQLFGDGLYNVMVAVGIGAIPGYARLVRAQVMTIREQEFIEAARSVGASDFRLIRKHILPNCMAPVIIEATMGMAGAIASAAALSFLGLGLQAPTPEWGALLSVGREWMLPGYWHMTVFPGVAIAMIIFSLNMMGDGLRDAFDPRLRSAGFSKKRFKKMLKAKDGGTA
jgi:peptide/nickel transport system permease protein